MLADTRWRRFALLATMLTVGLAITLVLGWPGWTSAADTLPPGDGNVQTAAAGSYILLAWNDLGMHWYNRDYQDIGVLPPLNNLWAQVVRVGNPPQIITTGVVVEYSFPDNTESASKTNFWTHAKQLFGADLAPNVGLKGKGLAGKMDAVGDHFVAEGIPLTEFRDSDPKTPYPYQLADVVLRDAATNAELARLQVVAPVSSEMMCVNCHADGGDAGPDIATGRVETNILTKHDRLSGTDLMSQRPVLCASCHGSNALGLAGVPGRLNLSNAIHKRHANQVTPDLDGCYNCHPGPQTRFLRDVMSQRSGSAMTCLRCHGDMQRVAQNSSPWLNEPRCDNTRCHGTLSGQLNQPLYRLSTGHAGIYCAACHDSPHAIAPSREVNDGLKFTALQGEAGPLSVCTVCHTTRPIAVFPHSAKSTAITPRSFLPSFLRAWEK